MAIKLRVIAFKELAEKQACSKEESAANFEKDVCIRKAFGVVSPDRSEAICFDPQEIQDLIAELDSGKVSLAYLAEELNLTSSQTHYVVAHLQKTGQIDGELTYSTFTTSSASRLSKLQKAKTHKQEHRQKMREKRR